MSTPVVYKAKRKELLALIQARKFSGNKLPTEEALTQMLSCSRGMLREILRDLELNGYITKKHSIGNFIHPSSFKMKSRIEIYSRFLDLISDAGYEASVKLLYSDPEHTQSPKLAKYRIDPAFFHSTDYTERLYLAGDHPAIFCECFVPRDIIIRDIEDQNARITLFNFLRTYCNQEIQQIHIHFSIELADERIANILDVEPGKPLYLWEEGFHNYCDELICASYNYFNLDLVPLSMLKIFQTPV
ncbi:MAG: GntR family transcriptional regulator [Bacillota bacterium]